MDFKKGGIRLRHLQTKQKHQSPHHKALPQKVPLVDESIPSQLSSCQTELSELMQILNSKIMEVEQHKQTIQEMQEEIYYLRKSNKEKQREIDRLKEELQREQALRESYGVHRVLPNRGEDVSKQFEEQCRKVRQRSFIEDTSGENGTLSCLVSPLMALTHNNPPKQEDNEPVPSFMPISENSEVEKFEPQASNQPQFLQFQDFQFSQVASSQQSSNF